MNDRYSLQPLESRRLMASGTILFVRGADRSGGFLEATNDTQRTEQLADINNTSTASGNHGWGSLVRLLGNEGYDVQQMIEPLESGAPSSGQTRGSPIAFQGLNLDQYTAIVMASNNAVYSRASVNALDEYIRAGGGVLFISDGNFGSNWADSPSSDNAFLGRYGMAVNQDDGTYALRRSAGDFVDPTNAVLIGVNAIDGEGVSPIRIGTVPEGVTIKRVIRARGSTYDNNPASSANQSRGTSRSVDSRDAVLAVIANAGTGRVAAFFDRNTFFNSNGTGTDLNKNNNTQFAKNLFNWVADNASPAVVSSSFTQGVTRTLKFRLDDNLGGTLTRDDIRMRHRKTRAAISGKYWSLGLSEGNGYTDVTIKISALAQAGPFQLQIDRRAFADDSGNVRTGAIRYAFTVQPHAASSPAAIHAVPLSTAFSSPEIKSIWADLVDH